MLPLKVILGVLIVLSAATAGEKPREVNICDVVRLASQLNGKIISVRGLLRNSETPEDPYFDELVPERCSDVEDRQIVIHIVSPDAHLLANPPPGYKPDKKSVRRTEPIFKKAAADRKAVLVTVEGLFQVWHRDTRMPPRHKQYSEVIVVQAYRRAKER